MAQLQAQFYQGSHQNRWDYLNATAADIAVGTVVTIGDIIGVVTQSQGIPKASGTGVPGQGSVATAGIFRLLKLAADTLSCAQGAEVYWDTVNKKAVLASGSGIVYAGLAAASAASSDTDIKTDINRYMSPALASTTTTSTTTTTTTTTALPFP
jgi:predicted RecA/RadA family phage recombinase